MYGDEQLDAKMRTDVEEMIAQKLLEVVSQDELEDCYYEMQREWAETLPDDELMQTARDLGIEYDRPNAVEPSRFTVCVDCNTMIRKKDSFATTDGRIVCGECADNTI